MGDIDKLVDSMHAESFSGDGSWARRIEQIEKNMEAGQILDALKKKENEVSVLRQQACDYFERNGYPDWEPDRTGRPDSFLKHLDEFEKALYHMEIGCTGHVLHIRIPAVLPHWKYKPEPAYFRPFCMMLEKYINDNPCGYAAIQEETKDGAVLAVKHSYQTRWLIRDNDNFEIRQIINFLHTYQLIQTDEGDYLSVFLTADGGTGRNQCDLYLMSESRFAEFLEKRSKNQHQKQGKYTCFS